MDTTPFLIVCLANLSAGCAFHRGSDKFQDDRRYSAYAGEYQMGTNVSMIVRPDRDRLMAKVSGQDYFQMFPSDGDSFFFNVVDAQVTFARSATGTVSGFALHQDGKDFRFHRTSPNVPDDGSKRIDAGGYRVRMIVRGTGAPTVVFEGGLGETLDSWEKVLPGIAEFSRVVAYDRSGLGLSERTGSPRTAEHVAQNLHRALRNANIAAPFVLVGNSAGGLYSRVFAHLYPHEMAGMVLVEPSSEEYEQWLHEKHPDAFQSVTNELETATQGFRDHVAGWEVSLAQARMAWPLPPIPIVVLTGVAHEEREAEKREMWLAMHRRFVQRVPGAKHIVSTRSGHGLASAEPDLIIQAVREVVDEVRRSKR
jgi:pimeloyl-ACP methyl ester carboxylesterase